MHSNKKTQKDITYFALLILIILTALFTLSSCRKANASGISDKVGVQCIMGEARGEGSQGLLAHAYALRNRGKTQGVYGCKAKFTEPEWVWKMARDAWELSGKYPKSDPTKGATYWGSTIVDKKWIAKMEKSGYVRTATVKNTMFYKEN